MARTQGQQAGDLFDLVGIGVAEREEVFLGVGDCVEEVGVVFCAEELDVLLEADIELEGIL